MTPSPPDPSSLTSGLTRVQEETGEESGGVRVRSRVLGPVCTLRQFDGAVGEVWVRFVVEA